MSAHATYQDVLNVPEHLTAELIDGAVFLSRRGSPRQALCRSILGTSLYRVPGWFVLWKPELRLERGVWIELAVFETAKPFRAEPFLGIEIDLGSIWASPPAP